MRGAAFLLVIASGAVARADVALRLSPFASRCFDAAELVERLRARGVVAQVGGSSGPDVELVAQPDGIDVRLTARDRNGNVTGVEQRHVGAESCSTVVETVELILVRAATPLRYMPDARERRPRRHDLPPESVEEPAPIVPNGVAEVRRAEAPRVEPPRTETPGTEPPPTRALPVVTGRAPLVAVDTRPRDRLRVELGLDGDWRFPLDGAPSEPAGDVEVGVRWSQRLGVALQVGVAKPWRSTDRSGDSAAALEIRRVPIALLLAVDSRLRHGRIRVAVGPLLELYAVSTSGVSHASTDWLAQPALEARAAYRYDMGRVFFEAGLELDAAIVREQLVVTGAGTLSHTPVVDLAPFVGVGLTL